MRRITSKQFQADPAAMIKDAAMRKLQRHSWLSTDRTEKSVNCGECGYRVIISHDDETKGGSKHMPEERTIYTDDTDRMTPEHADYLCRVWGVSCHIPKKRKRT